MLTIPISPISDLLNKMRCKFVLALSVIGLLLTGCASPVVSRGELFKVQPNRKECYSYDTLGQNVARNAPTSVGLGILGGLFPPLAIATALAAGAAAAANEAALPVKCGITFSDAVKEAWSASHYQKATAMWRQKGGGASVVAKYADSKEPDCSVHELTMLRDDSGVSKKFVETVVVCRNAEGEPVLR